MVKIFGKPLRYMGNGLSLFCFFINGFTMLEMALEFDKRLKYVENDVCIWEIS